MGRARTPPIAVWGPRGGPARRDAPLSAPCAGRHMRGKTRVAGNCRAPAAPSCRCHSPAEESRGRGCHTARSRKTRVAHRRVSRSPRGRHGTRRGKSPGALQSHCRAPSGWDPEVRRWEPLAPYEPPRTIGRRWKGQDLSPTILHICTVYKQNVWLGEEGNKRYAPRCPRGSGSKIPFEIPIHVTSARRVPCGGGDKMPSAIPIHLHEPVACDHLPFRLCVRCSQGHESQWVTRRFTRSTGRVVLAST